VTFATKQALAMAMITRAVTAGTPVRWVAGDEAYGNDPKLRKGIAGHGLGFVLAVARDHQIPTAAGSGARLTWPSACQAAHGSSCRPAMARKAPGSMTGPWPRARIRRCPQAARARAGC
jgi:SRSO17 transposase